MNSKETSRNPATVANNHGKPSDNPHQLFQGIRPPEFNVSFTSSGKGGGGMRSIGETFQVNPANGTMSMGIPIHTTPGRSGFGPSLGLSYNSGGGNGPFGMGWQLSAPQISRKVSMHIPLYDESDVFVIGGAEDLVPMYSDGKSLETVNGQYLVKKYRPRVEAGISRIERWARIDSPQDIHWKTVSGSNVTTIYGFDDASRIKGGETNRGQTFAWLACESYDGWGNAMTFTYKAEDQSGITTSVLLHESNRDPEGRSRARYLKSIKYGNRTPNRKLDEDGNYSVIPAQEMQWLFQLVLDYGEHDEETPTTKEEKAWPARLDPFSSYRTGFEIRQYRLCKRFLMFHHMPDVLGREDCLVSSTRLHYDENEAATKLTSAQQEGHIAEKNGLGYRTQQLPPVEFEYSKVGPLDDLRVEFLTTSMGSASQSGRDITSVDWVDLYGEGSPGLLLQLTGGAWTFQRNFTALGLKNEKGEKILGPTETLKANPNIQPNSFTDLDRNGQMDAVCLNSRDQINGYFERNSDGWTNYTSFPSMPNINLQDSSMQQADLTGDGLQDIMKVDAGRGIVSWFNSLGKQGYSEEKKRFQPHSAPQLSSDDESLAIYMADMSGDGLIDIIHVSDGKISYWPNLGYGLFGDEVSMSNAPSFKIGGAQLGLPERLRLMDIDGSGTTDILYFPPEGGAVVYYNLSGNSWSRSFPITQCPNLDTSFKIFTLDLLGSGTACLCWTDPQEQGAVINYIDLMKGRKPHLLIGYKNGIGGETTVEYKPSTFYFTTDEVSNRPWITKVPFPVQCVNRVVRSDRIAMTSNESRYAYHDGYYDPREQEFRGFGMVEQWDAEEFSSHSKKLFQGPPVHTKTWYHTGSPSYRPSYRFGSESLQPSQVSQNLSQTDITDAFRAMKGVQVLSETYSDDDSDKSLLPYVAQEVRYKVDLIQDSKDLNPAVFRVTQYETLSCSYERKVEDPRLQHTMNLQIDQYGNVLKSLAVIYGKRASELEDEVDKKKQEETVVKFAEITYSNAIDDSRGFLNPVAVASRDFRIFNLHPPGATNLLDITLISANDCATISSAPEIDFHDAPSGTEILKVLLAESRVHLRKEDMTSPLPLGALELNSTIDQSYQLSATNKMLQLAYGVEDGLIFRQELGELLRKDGYRDLDGDGRWWKPSGQRRFSMTAPAPEELSLARSQFFIPTITIDPLGNKAVLQVDDFNLLFVSKQDPLGNTVSVKYDYTHFSPSEIWDENKNCQQVALDAFGSVVAIANSGKAGEQLGDSLEDLELIVTPEQLDEFIQNPTGPLTQKLLGKAGSRHIYHPWRYYNADKPLDAPASPVFEAVISRQQHYYPRVGEIEESPILSLDIAYKDGNGSDLQHVSLINASNDKSPEVWRVSEWVIKNNKGQPVRVHQPSLASTHTFQFQPNTSSPSITTLLDPLDRGIGVLNSDHTWSKSRIDTWMVQAYSTIDTLQVSEHTKDPDLGPYFSRLDEESFLPTWYASQTASEDHWSREAAQKSLAYSTSPTTSHMDTLGNPILTIIKSRSGRELKTRITYDILGNKTESIDQYGRVVERKLYDYLGRQLQVVGIDSGFRWEMRNLVGGMTMHWNDRGVCIRRVYDSLGRAADLWLRQLDGTERLLTRFEYGESKPDEEAFNLNMKGKLVQVSDQSGIAKQLEFDFKGNNLRSSLQLCKDYKSIIDWQSSNELEDEVYETRNEFSTGSQPIVLIDALGRSTKTILGNGGQVKSLLWRETDIDEWTNIVISREYSAHGEILKQVNRNGTSTRYTYDPASQQLLNRLSERDDGSILQDITYTYDCQGRTTHEIDRAQQTAFVSNEIIKPASDYTYDEFGRLIEAQGRQQISAENGDQRKFTPYSAGYNKSQNILPVQGAQLAEYLETYTYDDANNILSMRHEAKNDTGISGWTRNYKYEEQSRITAGEKGNRLTQTQVNDTTETIKYDIPGDGVFEYQGNSGTGSCITSLPGFSNMTWNYEDKLRSSSTQVFRNGIPETTWYVYNSSGKRVRKVVDNAATNTPPTKMKETIYLPQCTIYQRYKGNGKDVKTRIASSEIASGQSHFAIAEKLTDAPLLMRYQLGDSLELDDKGQVISYEEFSPFGASTYMAKKTNIKAPRRYRFASYERDKETGLFFCNSRYYAPWLGRWLSPDPGGTVDGLNTYVYVSNDPINMQDITGTMGDPKRPNSGQSSGAESKKPKSEEAEAEEIQNLEYTCEKAEQQTEYEDHHLYRQKYKKIFQAAGININEHTVRVHFKIHRLWTNDKKVGHDPVWKERMSMLTTYYGGSQDSLIRTIKASDENKKSFKAYFEKAMQINLEKSALGGGVLDIYKGGYRADDRRQQLSIKELKGLLKSQKEKQAEGKLPPRQTLVGLAGLPPATTTPISSISGGSLFNVVSISTVPPSASSSSSSSSLYYPTLLPGGGVFIPPPGSQPPTPKPSYPMSIFSPYSIPIPSAPYSSATTSSYMSPSTTTTTTTVTTTATTTTVTTTATTTVTSSALISLNTPATYSTMTSTPK
ncbi:hypothetical protein ABW20_dc0101243 [Dactylellina cionopaga]|nr:hypothetical protein ABW20_dc0101243 [Dactylellina cionopaga]